MLFEQCRCVVADGCLLLLLLLAGRKAATDDELEAVDCAVDISVTAIANMGLLHHHAATE